VTKKIAFTAAACHRVEGSVRLITTRFLNGVISDASEKALFGFSQR